MEVSVNDIINSLTTANQNALASIKSNKEFHARLSGSLTSISSQIKEIDAKIRELNQKLNQLEGQVQTNEATIVSKEQEKSVLEKLNNSDNFKPKPDKKDKSFFDRVKEAFS